MKWITCALVVTLGFGCSQDKPREGSAITQGSLQAGSAEADAVAEEAFQNTLFQIDAAKGSEALLFLFYQSQLNLSRLFAPSTLAVDGEESGRCVLVSLSPLESPGNGEKLTLTGEGTIAYSEKNQRSSQCSQMFGERAPRDGELSPDHRTSLISFFSYTF